MAREHARILCSVWRPGDDFRDRSPEAQRLYFLLLSQRELNNAGVMPVMLTKWARCSAGTTVGDIEKALAELVEHRYVVVDEDTEELLVRTFVRNDGVLKHPHMRRSALRSAEQVESAALRSALARELLRSGHPEAIETASRLAADAGPSTQPDAIGSGTQTTQLDAVAMASPDLLQQPDSMGVGQPVPMPSPELAGWGGEGEGEGVSVQEGVNKGGKSDKPTPSNGSSQKIHTADVAGPPPDRCDRHLGLTDPPPCRACGAARVRAESWRTDAARRTADAGRRCRWCDADGWRIWPGARHMGPIQPGQRCDHTPTAEQAASVEEVAQ